MPFSTTYANQLLDMIFARRYGVKAPKVVYLALSKNNPEEDNGRFEEIAGDTYKRLRIASLVEDTEYDVPKTSDNYDVFNAWKASNDLNYIGSAANREISNVEQINWTKATARDWDASKGFGLFETPTGGAPFYYGKLDLTAEQVAAGGLICKKDSVMLFDPTKLKITFPTKDSISGTILYMISTLGSFGNSTEKATADGMFRFNTHIYETESPAFSVEDNTNYTVVWDGGEYLCESYDATYDGEDWVIIGNKKYTDTADTVEERDSHEPFTIFFKSGKMMFFADEAGTNNTHSIAVYKV